MLLREGTHQLAVGMVFWSEVRKRDHAEPILHQVQRKSIPPAGAGTIVAPRHAIFRVIVT